MGKNEKKEKKTRPAPVSAEIIGGAAIGLPTDGIIAQWAGVDKTQPPVTMKNVRQGIPCRTPGFYRVRNLRVTSSPKQRTRIFRVILIAQESRRTLDNFMLFLSFAHHLFCFACHFRYFVYRKRNRQDNEIATSRRCERKPIRFRVFFRSSPLVGYRQEGFLLTVIPGCRV